MKRLLYILFIIFVPLKTWCQQSDPIKSLLSQSETVVHINESIDLQNRTLYLPVNKKIIFSGGLINNGIIIGQNTYIQAGEKEQIFGDQLKVKGSWTMAARPEWFGAKGNGVNYYDKPLRCYNDTISDITIQPNQPQIKIAYPSSHIVNQTLWTFTPKHTTNDVFYDVKRRCFVICVNGLYFNKWKNVDQWNDPKTDKARTDVLFSNLQTRSTTFFKDGQMIDIDSTMTDDGMAISKAIQMGQGNVKLRNTIYYMKGMPTNGINKTYWRGLHDFQFDGNHATIFVRSRSKGSPVNFSQTCWAWMYQCANGTIKDLNFRALRDRDDGAPKGHFRFDSSDSRFVAFGIFNCKDITFQNMSFKGLSHDFIIKSKNESDISSNIWIDGWKSTDFTQNVLAGVHGCHINHADLTQADLIGGGMHIFYGQSRLRGLFVTNSRFRQSGPYTSVMLTHHGGSQNSSTCPDSIFYDNCIIEGARMVQGAGGQHQHFRNCTFRQIYDKTLTNNGKLTTNNYIIIGSGVNLSFDHCKFHVTSSGIINTEMTRSKHMKLTLSHCIIDAKTVSRSLFVHPGQVTLTDNVINSKGPIFSKNSTKQIISKRNKLHYYEL